MFGAVIIPLELADREAIALPAIYFLSATEAAGTARQCVTVGGPRVRAV